MDGWLAFLSFCYEWLLPLACALIALIAIKLQLGPLHLVARILTAVFQAGSSFWLISTIWIASYGGDFNSRFSGTEIPKIVLAGSIIIAVILAVTFTIIGIRREKKFQIEYLD